MYIRLKTNNNNKTESVVCAPASPALWSLGEESWRRSSFGSCLSFTNKHLGLIVTTAQTGHDSIWLGYQHFKEEEAGESGVLSSPLLHSEFKLPMSLSQKQTKSKSLGV